jgi:hypothetical protein
MATKININVLLLEDNLIFNKLNNQITIKVLGPDNRLIVFEENVLLKYELDNFYLYKKYYIETTYYIYYPTGVLASDNFLITFEDTSILYFYSNSNKLLYIYKAEYDIPFTMLGIRNVNSSVGINFIMNVRTINRTIFPYVKISNVKNYSINEVNTLQVLGNILTFSSPLWPQNIENSIILPLYKTPLPFNLTTNSRIYFYDSTYNYISNIPYKNTNLFTEDAVPILIQIFYNTDLRYQYLANLNFDIVSTTDSKELVLFFKNSTNVNSTQLVLRVFSYDFMSYFVTTVVTDYTGCQQITVDKSNLYDILILNNLNIPPTLILNLDINNYNLNIDIIRFRTMLFFEIKNTDIASKFLKSGVIETNILINYLDNYSIKDYNFVNVSFNPVQTKNNQFEKVNFFTNPEIYKKNYIINFNNELLNNILINIEIFFYDKENKTQKLNIFGTLINNNNTWDIYTKRIIFTTDTKYKFISDLVIIIQNFYQINIYSYNDINDLNNNIKKPVFTGSTEINPYYKFNMITTSKLNSLLGFILDENYFLKLSLYLTIDFKFFIFNVPKTVTDPILNFKNNNYFFKIFRINGITSNPDPGNNLYSILFSSIYDCNFFMDYIRFGTTTPPEKVSSYFNIPVSKYFKKDANGFYTITTLTTPNTGIIYFNINNANLEENCTFITNRIVSV